MANIESSACAWTTYDAVAACEGFDGIDHGEEELTSAWQFLIDTGTVWTLQGWFVRTAAGLIAEGICTPAGAREAA